jgi:transmembrane sensor
MEREPLAVSPEASREASEWFVFLQDDPEDSALRERFERWLAASPAHAAAWTETLRTSSLAESLLPFDARDWRRSDSGSVEFGVTQGRPSRGEARPPSTRRTLPTPVRRRSRRRLVALAASAIVAALAVWAAPAMLLYLRADFTTGTAEVREVALQDGSVVTLAADSAIAVTFAGNERRVRLLSGEAFFSVVPDATRPFHVTADSLTASVLGTSFDVDLRRDTVAVSVAEGRVQVRSVAAGIQEILDAGQSVRVATARPGVQRASQSPQSMAAWRHGQLILEDAPFGTALEQLGRYFGGSIVIVDSGLSERPVTGIFSLHDPEGAVQAIARALGVKVRPLSPWLLVVSAS